MNIIQSMIHEKLGEVRIIRSEDGNPMHTLFCAVDVVKSLGYPENSYRSTISRHCSAVRKTHGTDSLGREQNMNFIPLSDVFRLIDRSNKPEAIEFQDWLYEEVLPNLYQYGNYNMDNHINNPEFFNPEYTDGDINSAVQSIDMNRVIDGVLINDTIRIDTTNILRDSCIMIKDMLTPVYNNQEIMYNQLNIMFDKINELESQLNTINNNTEYIKQMIIPATIVDK